jgi:hypothetical protein
MMEINKKPKQDKQEEKDTSEDFNNIDRRKAIKKTGLIALSAATMMVLVGRPDRALFESPDNPPGW